MSAKETTKPNVRQKGVTCFLTVHEIGTGQGLVNATPHPILVIVGLHALCVKELLESCKIVQACSLTMEWKN